MSDGIVYHGDGRSRAVTTEADKVAATWDGFVLNEDPTGASQSAEKVDYRDLQAKAKEAGIPANQSADDLQKALAAYESEGGAAGADASSGGDPITPTDTQDNAHTD
jgi:hypothetical protein